MVTPRPGPRYVGPRVLADTSVDVTSGPNGTSPAWFSVFGPKRAQIGNAAGEPIRNGSHACEFDALSPEADFPALPSIRNRTSFLTGGQVR
jgi:hypothetical protein